MKRELFSGFLVISLLISMLGLAFNTRSGKAEAGTETHDLEVTLSHSAPAKYHVSSGNSTIINATAVNNGNVTEVSVGLILYINNTVCLNSTWQRLLPGPGNKSYSTYLWTPEDGVWNLTVYAPPLPGGELNITNNVDSGWVNVCADRSPTASFSYSPKLPSGAIVWGENVTFDASISTDLDDWGNITTYSWNLTGTPKNSSVPTSTYDRLDWGIQTVNLTVYDTESRSAWNVTPIKVCARPLANFTINKQNPYVNDTLTFDATSSYDPDNNSAPYHGIATYTWDFNDNTPVTVEEQPITNHTYKTPETYNVSLTVTDSDQGLNGSTINIVAVYFEVLLKVVDSETGNNYSVHDPGENFKINITVTNVVDLDYFEFTLTYPAGQPPPLLMAKTIEKGDVNLDDQSHSDEQGYIRVNSTAHLGGVNGSHTLAIITFSVTNPGNCTLYISHSMLRNTTTGGNILHTRLDADFMTAKPVANFTYKPQSPTVNQDVEFNASSSYDPDNMTLPNKGIANYTWDFKDGSNITTTNPITTHNYTEPGNYNVNLTVTDHEGKTSSFNKTISTQIFTHDVAILYAGPPSFLLNHTSGLYETSGELPINVTVKNNGTAEEETFDVTVYANNTTGFLFEIGSQIVTLSAWAEKNITFWLCAFKYDATGPKLALSTGNYTISANATVVEFDTDPNNNFYRCEGIIVRVHLVADVSGGDEPGVPDKKCDMKDIAYLVILFNTKPPPPNWNPDADLDGNGVVNMRDIATAILYFNTSEL